MTVKYLYGVGLDNHIWKTVPEHGPWKTFANDGTNISKIIFNEDIIYGVGTDNAVYQTSAIASTSSGGSWTKVAPAKVTNLVYSKGYFFGVGTDHMVWRMTKPHGEWKKFTGCCVHRIIIVGDILYGIKRVAITTGYRVTKASGTAFRSVPRLV